MHKQRGLQSANLREVFFRFPAMISNGSVDFVAGGREKYHQAAKTISEQGDLSSRLSQLNSGADRFYDIPRTRIAIKRRIKSETVLPGGIRSHVEIDSRLLPPEQVRRDRDEPWAANSSQVARMSGLTPNTSWRTTTAGTGNLAGLEM